jgi:hypothetical protein
MCADEPGPRDLPRGFDAARRQQARRLAALSLAGKLDWLEEAHRLVSRIERARAGGDVPRDRDA